MFFTAGILREGFMYEYTVNEKAGQKAHERLCKAYRMEQTDRVPVVELAKKDLGYTIRQIALKKECMLSQQLANITMTSRLDTDYVPFLEP